MIFRHIVKTHFDEHFFRDVSLPWFWHPLSPQFRYIITLTLDKQSLIGHPMVGITRVNLHRWGVPEDARMIGIFKTCFENKQNKHTQFLNFHSFIFFSSNSETWLLFFPYEEIFIIRGLPMLRDQRLLVGPII